MFLAQRQEAPNSTSAELNGSIPAFPHPDKENENKYPLRGRTTKTKMKSAVFMEH
jgi:hypothetical protein